jgi:DNA-binding transcriptional regulator YiaG
MEPGEFKAKRQAIWGTQKRCAEALGVTIVAVKNYEHGRRKVPEMAVKLLDCIENDAKMRQEEGT